MSMLVQDKPKTVFPGWLTAAPPNRGTGHWPGAGCVPAGLPAVGGPSGRGTTRLQEAKGAAMKRAVGAIAVAVLALGGVSACSHSRSGYDTMCVNPLTQIRVTDFGCNPLWLYYVPFGYYAPAYGGHVTNYSVNNNNRPSGATVRTGSVPTAGGKASKPATISTPKPAAPKATSNKVTVVKPPAPKPPAPKAPAPAPKVGGKR